MAGTSARYSFAVKVSIDISRALPNTTHGKVHSDLHTRSRDGEALVIEGFDSDYELASSSHIISDCEDLRTSLGRCRCPPDTQSATIECTDTSDGMSSTPATIVSAASISRTLLPRSKTELLPLGQGGYLRRERMKRAHNLIIKNI